MKHKPIGPEGGVARMASEATRKQKLCATKIDRFFESQPKGELSREKMRELLVAVNGTEPTEKAMDLVMDRAYAIDLNDVSEGDLSIPYDAATKSVHTNGKADPRGIRRGSVAVAVKKYAYYAKESSYVDNIFAKFGGSDADELTPDDVKNMCEAMSAMDAKDSAPTPPVSDEDIAFVMERCDRTGSGKISREELIPALTLWKEIMADRWVPESVKEKSLFGVYCPRLSAGFRRGIKHGIA